MQVEINELNVQMDLGNNGITLLVRNTDGSLRGKLRVGRGTIEWCYGKQSIGNGSMVSWEELIAWFEGDE